MADKTIRGYIASDGTVNTGTGFSVQHDSANDPGVYYITFDAPFADTPAVTVSIVNTDWDTGWYVYSIIKALDASSFEVIFIGGDVKTKFDTEFTFLATGTNGSGS